MKASAFLKLVGEARKEAKAYYAAKRDHPIEGRIHLIEAKRLEKLVDQVVAEGRLEPDEPTATPEWMANQRKVLKFDEDGVYIGPIKWGWNDDIAVANEMNEMGDEADAGDLLDTSA